MSNSVKTTDIVYAYGNGSINTLTSTLTAIEAAACNLIYTDYGKVSSTDKREVIFNTFDYASSSTDTSSGSGGPIDIDVTITDSTGSAVEGAFTSSNVALHLQAVNTKLLTTAPAKATSLSASATGVPHRFNILGYDAEGTTAYLRIFPNPDDFSIQPLYMDTYSAGSSGTNTYLYVFCCDTSGNASVVEFSPDGTQVTSYPIYLPEEIKTSITSSASGGNFPRNVIRDFAYNGDDFYLACRYIAEDTGSIYRIDKTTGLPTTTQLGSSTTTGAAITGLLGLMNIAAAGDRLYIAKRDNILIYTVTGTDALTYTLTKTKTLTSQDFNGISESRAMVVQYLGMHVSPSGKVYTCGAAKIHQYHSDGVYNDYRIGFLFDSDLNNYEATYFTLKTSVASNTPTTNIVPDGSDYLYKQSSGNMERICANYDGSRVYFANTMNKYGCVGESGIYDHNPPDITKTIEFSTSTVTGANYGSYIDVRKLSGTSIAAGFSSYYLSTFYANSIYDINGSISQAFTLYDIAYWNNKLVMTTAEKPKALIVLDPDHYGIPSFTSSPIVVFYEKSYLSPPENTEGQMRGAVLATCVTKASTVDI